MKTLLRYIIIIAIISACHNCNNGIVKTFSNGLAPFKKDNAC